MATVWTASVGGEVTQRGVAASVAALERALELDVEAIAAEHRGEPRCGARVEDGEPPAGATGEADEALGVLLQQDRAEARLEPVACVGGGEKPAEVGVSARRFAEESHVGRRSAASVTSAPVIGRTPSAFAA